ncbi:MAG: T9SS type A sorting domain-containing protein [Flavobacteriales bacterium]
MRIFYLAILAGLFCSSPCSAQYFTQYFDGADTADYNSIFINIDTTGGNLWQIGPPQKNIFDSPATSPNVIVTDTINFYPDSDTSSFVGTVPLQDFGWGIFALQWTQKLDMDDNHDGGTISFSFDSLEWQQVFDDPDVYNFYGYQSNNEDVFGDNQYGFTGTDTTWRDLWLCFDLSWFQVNTDTVFFKFTFMSDTIPSDPSEILHEGWMIDNMIAHQTFQHTLAETEQTEYLKCYPNPSNDRLMIEAKKLQEFHIIEKMELINSLGQVVDSWMNIPTKYFIRTQEYENGHYLLRIQTNIKTETIPVIINH